MTLVELLCKQHDDGTFRARITVDGAPDPNLHIERGTCDDLRQIWLEARDKYMVPPSISGDCKDCFQPEFLQREAEPRIDSSRGQATTNDKADSENGE
jgi:hypothetical protein